MTVRTNIYAATQGAYQLNHARFGKTEDLALNEKEIACLNNFVSKITRAKGIPATGENSQFCYAEPVKSEHGSLVQKLRLDLDTGNPLEFVEIEQTPQGNILVKPGNNRGSQIFEISSNQLIIPKDSILWGRGLYSINNYRPHQRQIEMRSQLHDTNSVVEDVYNALKLEKPD